jgi:hypothetical protein
MGEGHCNVGPALKKPTYIVGKIRNTRRGSSETAVSVTLGHSIRARNNKPFFKYDHLFRPVKVTRYLSLTQNVNPLAKLLRSL